MASSGSNNTRRNRPHAGGKPLVRSKSFLGTIKNLVTAPLTWFAANETSDTEEARGKRRLPQSNSVEDFTQGNGSRNKKMRVNSPDRQFASGYLDPPETIFRQSAGPQYLQPHSLSPSAITRHPGSIFTQLDATQRQPHYRHSVSPFASNPEARPLSMARTMSLDPPYQYGHSRNSSMALLPRDTSMDASSLRNAMSVSRDVSMPPVRGSFQMCTSLTPKPSGSTLGLSQRPRERDPSEPPPVTSLMSNPIFVRPPPEALRSMSLQPTVTLGSYVDFQRRTQSPARQHSALLFAQPGSSAHVSGNNRMLSPAEKALHELDVYKTPLLPSRLKSASAVPDIFKPKKARNLILMHDKDGKSRLGVPGKRKHKRPQVNSTKPYAGEGGMKKLLARRRLEEEEDKDKVAGLESHGEDTERLARPIRRRNDEISTPESELTDKKESDPRSRSSFSERSSEMTTSRPQSSLRVGRTKTRHLARPARPLNRFSARYADDEGDDLMQDDSEKNKEQLTLEEAAKNVPVFDIKPGFTFAKEVTPMEHDLGEAKEPPIATLPYSFAKPNAKTDTMDSSAQNTAHTPGSEKSDVTIGSSSLGNGNVTLSSIVTPPAPDIALIPPTSDPLTLSAPINEVKVTESAGSQISQSSTSETVTVQSNFTFSSAGPVKSAIWNDGKQAGKENQTAQSSFNLFPTGTKPIPAEQEQPPPQLFAIPHIAKNNSAFGDVSTSAPSFGTSALLQPGKTDSTPSTSLFGSFDKQPNSSAFSFSVPPEATEHVQSAPPIFSFGPPKSETSKELDTTIKRPLDTSVPALPLVTAPAPTSTFKELAPTVADPPKLTSAFVPAGPLATVTTSTTQPVSSVNTGFSLGQPPSSTGEKAKGPFSFGAPPSTPPANTEKKPIFTFGPLATSESTPAVSFGAPAANITATDVSSKGFTFGMTSTSAARSITPPKTDDQDLRMEESPTRDMQLNGSNKESRPTLFSFANTSNSATAPFGQSSRSSSTPFSFAPPAANTFQPKVDSGVAESTPMTFSSFGQNQSSNTGFNFGSKPIQVEPPKQSTATPFAFQTTPTTATGPSFTFTPPTTTHNPFTQANPQSGSTPSSPSTFNQPSSTFIFQPPATAPTAPFTFGSSQPSSPASAGNMNLAPAPTGTFTFGSGQATQTTSPFGTPTTALPPSGALFTIGAAPPTTPHPGRQVKRLPQRRGGKR